MYGLQLRHRFFCQMSWLGCGVQRDLRELTTGFFSIKKAISFSVVRQNLAK